MAMASASSRSGYGATQPSVGTVAIAIGTKSSCGNQANSTRTSNPSVGFGTSTRTVRSKLFLSNEHVKKANNTEAYPAPCAYNVKSVATGKQASSKVKTTPSYGFGSSVRFDKVKDNRTASVPGPGAYTP